MSRTPKDYDGIGSTSKQLGGLLGSYLKKVEKTYEQRPDLVVKAWPDVAGQLIAGMTEAVSFIDGTLNVKVRNSLLLSVLNQQEKNRLLPMLQRRFPQVGVKDIMFRLG